MDSLLSSQKRNDGFQTGAKQFCSSEIVIHRYEKFGTRKKNGFRIASSITTATIPIGFLAYDWKFWGIFSLPPMSWIRILGERSLCFFFFDFQVRFKTKSNLDTQTINLWTIYLLLFVWLIYGNSSIFTLQSFLDQFFSLFEEEQKWWETHHHRSIEDNRFRFRKDQNFYDFTKISKCDRTNQISILLSTQLFCDVFVSQTFQSPSKSSIPSMDLSLSIVHFWVREKVLVRVSFPPLSLSLCQAILELSCLF